MTKKNSKDWINRIGCVVGVISLLVSIIALTHSCSAENKANDISEQLLTITSSKYADIRITALHQSDLLFNDDEKHHHNNVEILPGLVLNVINTGQTETGQVLIRILGDPFDGKIKFGELRFNNILAQSSKIGNISIRLNGISERDEIFGTTTLTLLIYCPNCNTPNGRIEQNLDFCYAKVGCILGTDCC